MKYIKELGRKIRYIQPEIVASTAADIVSDHQATTNLRLGDFCTIQCTTGTMYLNCDVLNTTLTTNKNGLEMTSGDTIDFISATSFIQTLSTAANGKFQMIIWDS